MLPKSHILYGAIFSLLVWLIFPSIGFYALVIFLSSFLIDFDHYLIYVRRKKDFNLKKASKYFVDFHEKIKQHTKKGKKIKAPLMAFHTIELLFFIAVLSLFSKFFFFLFLLIGFLFHSVMDIIQMLSDFGTLKPRSFSLIFYLLHKDKNTRYL